MDALGHKPLQCSHFGNWGGRRIPAVYVESPSFTYMQAGVKLLKNKPLDSSGNLHMKTSTTLHIGSDLEDFLAEENMLDTTTAAALKRALVWQIQTEMKLQHLTKTSMAKRMNTSRSSLDRLLDENDTSLTLTTLASAAQPLGKQIKIELVGTDEGGTLCHSIILAIQAKRCAANAKQLCLPLFS